MAYTLLLNDKWDIYVDGNGNIATTSDEYAIAQNAANAIRLFTNDAYFDQTRGIPHFQIELGKKAAPARSTLNNRMRKAVMAVEGVQDAEVLLEFNEQTRTFGGEVILTTVNGTSVRVEV